MNNNKMDTQGANGTEGLRVRSFASARGEKKHRASFLVVDLLLLLGVIAVIFLLVLAFTPLKLFGGDTEPREILYTLEFYAVDKDMEHVFREGDTVVDVQTGKELGVIKQVSSRVYEAYTDIPSDEIVPEFDKYVVQKEINEEWRILTVSIAVTADYEPGIGYTVSARRIAVGREYELRFFSYTDSGVCVSLTPAQEGGKS